MKYKEDNSCKMFDLLLHHPGTFLVSGPTFSGKSFFLKELLENKSELFRNGREIKNVIYFYKEWQDKFEEMKKNGTVTEFINQFPSNELINEKTSFHKNTGGSLILIDDYLESIDRSTSVLFSSQAHHGNLSVVLIVQNLFSKNKYMRDISLNSMYNVIFKNPRDKSQISYFGKQVAPSRSKFIVDVFAVATAKPFSYLFFDNTQLCPDIIRIRSDILPSQAPMKVWIEKTCST